MTRCPILPLMLMLLVCVAGRVEAQRPETTERRVENPIGEAEAQRQARRREPSSRVSIVAEVPAAAAETVDITADRQESAGDKVMAVGNVQVLYGDMMLIADRVSFDRVTGEMIAEGSVYFEQQGQRLIGERFEFNARTKQGTIYESTTFTNRTPDGTMVIIDSSQVDKTGERSFALRNAIVTACLDAIPKWSLTASRARIELDRKATVYNALFRIKRVPVFYLPYASISISKRDRSSGFLIPSSGASTLKGRTLHAAYYQTLGRSADVLVRTDIFSKRGIGLGYDFRARTNATSKINFGSFMVFDRLFGEKGVNQGGSSFYADAAHNFDNGFVAVADVNITSSFAFRQVFAENIQAAISPEERYIFYANKNWGAYSFNTLFGEQSSFIGDEIVKVRRLPSLELSRRSTKVSERLPFYFAFDAAFEGVRRSETQGDNVDLKTPSVVQRLDFAPRMVFPLRTFAGFALTPSLTFRSTFYSDSLDPIQRKVIGVNLFRNYVDLDLDLRAPALARIFRHRDGTPWFRHVIEPFVEYRRIAGIDQFERTLRVDERDIVAGTNEVAYGVSNSFLVRRAPAEGGTPQPHELLNLTIVQKYFFDPTFGGALREGERNQFFPINTLAGFAFGGVPRRTSPLNLRARLRPSPSLFADLRVNYDTRFGQLRDLIAGGGFNRGMINFSQTWYYTRRVDIGRGRFDAATLPGNQFDLSAFIGNPARGPYVGLSMINDLRDRSFVGLPINPRLINFTTSIGWAWDCCSLNIQRVTFNAGLRNENRLLFAFTLRGIGSFGTNTFGQRRPR